MGIIFASVSIAFLLLAALLPFASAIKWTVTSSTATTTTTYGNAFAFIFGGKVNSTHATYQNNQSIPLGIAAYILLLSSLVSAFTRFAFLNTRLASILLSLGSAILSMVAGIMFFCLHQGAITVLASMISTPTDAVIRTLLENTSLQFGIIGPGLFSLAATAISISHLFVSGSFMELIAKFK